MVWTYWRIKLDTDFSVNDILDAFYTMGFGVEISKLLILSCAHRFECLAKIKLVYSLDQDVKRPGLGSYIEWKKIIVAWLSSYNFMEVLWGNQFIYKIV